MIRFTLSRFCPQAALAAGLVAGIAVALGVTGAHLDHRWDTTLGPCLAAHPAIARYGSAAIGGVPCHGALSALSAGYAPYGWLRQAAGIAVLVVPGLAGQFRRAQLIAQELHDGTWRLAWTQSVTRNRWLAVKLAVAGAASMAMARLLSLVATWRAGPLDRLTWLNGDPSSGRFSPPRLHGYPPRRWVLRLAALRPEAARDRITSRSWKERSCSSLFICAAGCDRRSSQPWALPWGSAWSSA